MICEKCNLAHMLQHPEQPFKWFKCPICGFCLLAKNKDAKVIVSNDRSINKYLCN